MSKAIISHFAQAKYYIKKRSTRNYFPAGLFAFPPRSPNKKRKATEIVTNRLSTFSYFQSAKKCAIFLLVYDIVYNLPVR